jgi:hypothetical protein
MSAPKPIRRKRDKLRAVRVRRWTAEAHLKLGSTAVNRPTGPLWEFKS